MDAVQKANSGHPGTPMALAPVAYLLYTRIMRHSPEHPEWPARDRLVLAAAPLAGEPGVARARPLRALGGARVDAPLLDAAPHRVRHLARRHQELPAARV